MPNGPSNPVKGRKNHKSVNLNLGNTKEATSNDNWELEFDFEPVPLTARSSALSFAASTAVNDESTPETTHHVASSSRQNTKGHSHRRSNSIFASFNNPASSMAMAAMNMISPRSGNYDRLEGGMGPSRTGEAKKGWRRFGWKKFAIGAAVLLFVVWLWGPRERRFDWKEVGSKVKEGLGGKPADVLVPPIHHEEEYPSTKSPSKGAPKSPLSFETDPDPSKTSFCEKPHDPASHLVQFALMIDAGSTGSRIHVYKFNNCKASPQYEYEVFKMNQPGLSSFAGKPLAAAKSLDELLDLAVKVVPEDLHHCTPVAVKATAGLRLLPGRQSHDILEAVENRIKKKYDFQLPAKDGVVIMDGKDEGVYAWITANYLLGTLSAAKPTAGVKEKKADTYAVLDLGGASTQIVFEPNFTPAHAEGRLEEGEHKYELNFGGRKYELYQHSYLGYGLMRARRHVHRLVDFMATIRPGAPERHHQHDHDHDEPEVVPNPCLARHTERRVEITDEGVSGEAWNVTMSGGDVGSFEACERVVQLVLAKDAVCELKPCSFNGVYQPSLLDSFQNGKVLLLSYFYDRLAPLLPPASAEPLSVDSFASTAKAMCGGPDAWAKQSHWIGNKELMDEIHGRPEWCLDLTFMHGLLRMGYEFEDTRRIDIGKKIRNTELGWCLGATISMVSGGELTCKA